MGIGHHQERPTLSLINTEFAEEQAIRSTKELPLNVI